MIQQNKKRLTTYTSHSHYNPFDVADDLISSNFVEILMHADLPYMEH